MLKCCVIVGYKSYKSYTVFLPSWKQNFFLVIFRNMLIHNGIIKKTAEAVFS